MVATLPCAMPEFVPSPPPIHATLDRSLMPRVAVTIHLSAGQTVHVELRAVNDSSKYELNRIVGEATYDIRLSDRASMQIQIGALSALTTNETVTARYIIHSNV